MAGAGADSGPTAGLLEEFDRLRRRVRLAQKKLEEFRQLERRLQRAESRFQSLLDSVRMFAVGLDERGRLAYANSFFLEVTGYALEEVRGAEWSSRFVPESHRGIISPLLEEVLHTGVNPRFEHPVVTRDGSERIVAWTSGWHANDSPDQNVLMVLGADVTEQRRAEDALRQSESRYRAIVEDQTEMVCRVDAAGRLRFVNSAACDLFGRDRNALLSREFSRLWQEQECERIERLLASLEHPGAVRGTELALGHSEAERRWIQCTVRRLDDAISGRKEFQIVGFDVTEQRRASEELKRALASQRALGRELELARERAERATEEKSRFLAHMSHEIRTPMNGVLGGVHLMLEAELSPEQRETLEIVRSSAHGLLELINEILDLSRIEAGKLELESVPLRVRGLVDDVTTMLAPAAYEKGLELISLVHADVPEQLEGDPARVRQILTNLVANATRFTERGEIVIRVTVVERSDATCTIEFDVSDTGIGIPAESMDRLFKSFSQIDTCASRRHDGSGLGLVITKALVDLMGGRIEVSSSVGVGSSFRFSVPLTRILQRDGAELDGASEPCLAGVEVLVAEGHALTRQAILSRLAAEGCRCREATSAGEALDELLRAAGGSRPVRLLVVGSALDDGGGETLGEAVRSEQILAGLPMVMLTSGGLRGDAARMERIGFDGYVTKPVRGRQLAALLRRVLTRERGRPGRASEPILTRFDVSADERRHVLLVEDVPTNQKIVVRMLERLGCRVDVAANGEQGVTAARDRDYDVVLMDCAMPVMDGFEATRRIRALDGPRSRVPIVALTAQAVAGDRERCLSAGMDDYVSKPISSTELSAVLERLTRSPQPMPC
jgi:PAS domain S-box-containing protein